MNLSLKTNKIPKHIAIIMDGNRRWAIKNNTSLFKAHKKGLEKISELLEISKEIGIEVLSLFAFSEDNWKRSKQEINDLMYLFRYFFKKEFNAIKKNGIKILYSGIKEQLDKDIQNIIDTMTEETKENNKAILNLAINYSGRQEILYAVNNIIKKIKTNNTKLKDWSIDYNTFTKYLFQPELSEPELLIRTSGEQRISNFLLWQMAYTELYFTDVLWPDFSKKDLLKAISSYQKRERRFGGRIGK